MRIKCDKQILMNNLIKISYQLFKASLLLHYLKLSDNLTLVKIQL